MELKILDQFDIYISNIYNTNHIPYIYQSIQTAFLSYYTSSYTITELNNAIELKLPSNWIKQKGKYAYIPKDKELLKILKEEGERKNAKITGTTRNMMIHMSDMSDADTDVDMNIDIVNDGNLSDNYAYLLEYIKESSGQNDILTRLKEMEDKFNKDSKQYTTSCGSGKYPTVLNKTELVCDSK